MTIDELLAAAEEHQASDVFIQEDQPPRLKIQEQIMFFGEEPMTLAQVSGLWQTCGADPHQDLDKDSGLISASGIRFRVNLHRVLGKLGAVLRRIRTDIPSLESLGVPAGLLQDWARRENGLILITGPTGTGKSTTLAAMLQWLNQSSARHIVTIEDPVEFLFTNENSVFTQREVGRDTESFERGLRSAMRQAPDVIFVGEIRDYDTALTALQAAETGHLVLASLHSERISDTMERFLNLFSGENEGIGIHLLAHQLIGILSQKLVPSTQEGLVLLTEYIENQGAVRDWISRRDVDHLEEYLNRGDDPRSMSFLQSILHHYREGRIDEATGAASARNETEFRRAAKGIS